MDICFCVRCDYKWLPRKLTRPDRCAKCHAKYWWRPARVAITAPESTQPVGRPRRYRVDLLNIGQSMTLPYEDVPNVLSCKQSISAYERHSGRRFKLTTSPAGIKATRTL